MTSFAETRKAFVLQSLVAWWLPATSSFAFGRHFSWFSGWASEFIPQVSHFLHRISLDRPESICQSASDFPPRSNVSKASSTWRGAQSGPWSHPARTAPASYREITLPSMEVAGNFGTVAERMATYGGAINGGGKHTWLVGLQSGTPGLCVQMIAVSG